jgi:hypothetical protein
MRTLKFLLTVLASASAIATSGAAAADNFDYHRPRLIPFFIGMPAGKTQLTVNNFSPPCPTSEVFYLTGIEVWGGGPSWAVGAEVVTPWLEPHHPVGAPKPVSTVWVNGTGTAHVSYQFQAPAPFNKQLRVNGMGGVNYLVLVAGQCGPVAPDFATAPTTAVNY